VGKGCPLPHWFLSSKGEFWCILSATFAYELNGKWLVAWQKSHRWDFCGGDEACSWVSPAIAAPATILQCIYQTTVSTYFLHWNSSAALKLSAPCSVWSSPLPWTWAWELCHRVHQDDSQPLPPSPANANAVHNKLHCVPKKTSTFLFFQ